MPPADRPPHPAYSPPQHAIDCSSSSAPFENYLADAHYASHAAALGGPRLRGRCQRADWRQHDIVGHNEEQATCLVLNRPTLLLIVTAACPLRLLCSSQVVDSGHC